MIGHQHVGEVLHLGSTISEAGRDLKSVLELEPTLSRRVRAPLRSGR